MPIRVTIEDRSADTVTKKRKGPAERYSEC